MTDKERRRHERKDVEGVQGSFLYGADVKLVDLSLSGLALETDRYLPLGRRYSLKLSGEETPIEISGRVAWSRLVRTEAKAGDDVRPVYRVGLRLENALSQQGDAILRYLLQHTTADTTERIFGRFRLADTEAVAVSRRSPFEVRKLSPAGMEILTAAGPEIDEVLEFELWLGGDETIKVEGRVADIPSGEDSLAEDIIIGVEFLNLNEEASQRISGLVEGYEGSRRDEVQTSHEPRAAPVATAVLAQER